MDEEVDPAPLHENKLIAQLVNLVMVLNLEPRDFVIFGSGPLLAHGLRQTIGDLDVVVRGAVWDRVSARGAIQAGSVNGAPTAVFHDGDIQFSSGWISDDWDPDDLINRAEIIQGLPFAQLADVLRYKQALGRSKDQSDVEKLLARLATTQVCG